MLRHFAVAALIASARLATAAGGPVPDFVPPTTNAVIGFDLRAIFDSALVQDLGADLIKNARGKWSSLSPFPGFDPRKDLDGIVVASTLDGDKSPSLVICNGRFPLDEMSKDAELYRGVPIRQVQGGQTMALLDAGTIIAGELKQVRAAIDRREAHTAGLNPALARRIEQMSGKYAIWGAGILPKGFHPPSGGPDGFSSLDRFDFGVALTRGITLAATLHVREPADAEKLAATMHLFEAISKAQPDASGTTIETHVENGTLSLSLSMPEEALKKAVEQQRGAFAQMLSQAAAKQQIGAQPPAETQPRITGSGLTSANPPASRETQIVTDDKGNTLQVTLPGKRD